MQTDPISGTTAKKAASKVRTKAKGTTKSESAPGVTSNSHDIASMIATAAYFHAERRGFEPGHELEDWLAAEQQVRTTYAS